MRTKIVAKKTSGGFRTAKKPATGAPASAPAWALELDSLVVELLRVGMAVEITAPFTGPSRTQTVRIERRLTSQLAVKLCWGDCAAATLVPLHELTAKLEGVTGSVLAYRLWKLAQPLYERLVKEGS